MSDSYPKNYPKFKKKRKHTNKRSTVSCFEEEQIERCNINKR